jgi:hypothetical protein
MQPLTSSESRTSEITRIIQTEDDVALLRQHVKEVMEGPAFKGSQRSGQFLNYIVEQAIAGHFESLKERVIGVELFGRSPSYDTGDDAIVRVTASDVRRRLLQHYGQHGASTELRISLPLGSYVPEVSHEPQKKANTHQEDNTKHQEPTPAQNASAIAGLNLDRPAVLSPTETVRLSGGGKFQPIRWGRAAIVIFVAAMVGIGALFTHALRKDARVPSVPPWSAFFTSPNSTQVIMSDANLVTIQEFTGEDISTSDYANHKYISEPNTLTPEASRLSHIVMQGDNPAEVDTPIVVNIDRLAQAASRKITVRGARGIQLSDLKSDDNFVFLGSPRSNPWTRLFSDQLDFRFAFDKNSGQEIIRNVHPRPNELEAYIPTALGWATGKSFAIIALVQNPDQNGHALLLAGANGEGTEAAGRIVTDQLRFSEILQNCGISSSGPLQKFELLLELNTMAGSPSNVEVIACHILPPGTSPH